MEHEDSSSLSSDDDFDGDKKGEHKIKLTTKQLFMNF